MAGLVSLAGKSVQPVEKTLLHSESCSTVSRACGPGTTFGPDPPDGRKSLILVSDNHFSGTRMPGSRPSGWNSTELVDRPGDPDNSIAARASGDSAGRGRAGDAHGTAGLPRYQATGPLPRPRKFITRMTRKITRKM